MIEVTVRLKGPVQARRLAAQLRALAAAEADRGQSRYYRSAAARLENIPRCGWTTRPARPTHTELDQEAIERVVRGIRPFPELSRAEARIACQQLTARGHSAPEIAARVRVARRTVNRWRAEDQRQAVPR